MEMYETLGVLGEGTYGVVVKARHKETQQLVAIKKFKESDEDEHVRKTSLREIRMLKNLRHFNIVNLLEVFRRKQKLYLVFEFIDRTILELVEKKPYGLDEGDVRKYTYQLLRAVDYCHRNNVIHRDIKPENILIAKNGTLKLCDFGFARALGGAGAKYTEYVATRWYRSPELLVGDTEYGRPVDVWAIGCILAEVSTGMPLFPGESDIDQLNHIIRCFGRLIPRHEQIFKRNREYAGIELPVSRGVEPLDSRFGGTSFTKNWLQFLKSCLRNEPDARDPCPQLMQLPYFTDKGFDRAMEEELERMESKERSTNQWWTAKIDEEHKPPAPPAMAPLKVQTPPTVGTLPLPLPAPAPAEVRAPHMMPPPAPAPTTLLPSPHELRPPVLTSSVYNCVVHPLPVITGDVPRHPVQAPVTSLPPTRLPVPTPAPQPVPVQRAPQQISMFGGSVMGHMSTGRTQGLFAQDFNVVTGLGARNSGTNGTGVLPTLPTTGSSDMKLMYKKNPMHKNTTGVGGTTSVPTSMYNIGTYGGGTTVLHPGGSVKAPSTSHAQTRDPMNAPPPGIQRKTSKTWGDSK